MPKPNLRPDHNGTQRSQFASHKKKIYATQKICGLPVDVSGIIYQLHRIMHRNLQPKYSPIYRIAVNYFNKKRSITRYPSTSRTD